MERATHGSTQFNWGGVAIYVEITTVPLAVTCPLSQATVGTFYASPYQATGGSPEYSYTLASGGLPPGLQQLAALYNPNVYGIPTTAGSYPFTVMVTDSANQTAIANCNIMVTQ